MIFVTDVGWLSGDVIAGLTVGMVLVPQGMSYAQVIVCQSIDVSGPNQFIKLATLPAEYGLYSSFVGVFIYCVSPSFHLG